MIYRSTVTIRLSLLCAFFTLVYTASAQDFNGFIYSEFSGILGVRVQPASIAGSLYKSHISLVNGSINASNNISELVGAEGRYEFQRIIENDRKFLQANLAAGGLSAMFSLPGQQAVGIQFQFRTHASTNNIAPEFANQFQNWRDPQILNIPFQDQTGSLAASGWREIAITYARVLEETKQHRLKLGLTGKLVHSHGSLFVELGDFDYTLLGQGLADVSSASVKYGYSDNLNSHNNFGGTESFSTLPKATGASLAFDLGIIYEHKANRRPLHTKRGTLKRREFDYDFKIGLSVTDLGVMPFNHGSLSTKADQLISSRVDPVNLNVVFARPTSLDELTTNLSEFLITESLTGKYTMALPAATHLNVDYNLGKGFFLNSNIRLDISSLLPAEYRLHYYSNMTLTPRWENRHAGFYFPVNINQIGQFSAGAALRMGPLVLGSQDWSSLFSPRKRAFSFFFTINLVDFAYDPGKAVSCFIPGS